MKKNILLLFAAFATLAASAQTKVEIGGIWYNLDESTQKAEVTYKGDYASQYDEYSGSITIPATINHEGVKYSVTSIGDYAFYDCRNLTQISFPDNSLLTSFGNSAFYYCESLASFTIPEGVTSIGENTFIYCSSLTAVTIPKDVTSISNDAFAGCSCLTSITVAAENTVYDSRGGCNGIIETESNILIVGCSATVIPESVTSIGDEAFSDCRSLTAINIPESVTSIGYNAFYQCSSLTSVTIPKSVTSIGWRAFSWCGSLTVITIPESVTSIGRYAFEGCRSLTGITVAEGNTVYDSRGGCNGIIETESNTLIVGCSATVIPESVTSIGDGAFYYCESLTTIIIPEGVTSIGYGAFSWCSSLTTINIPEGVTSIEGSTFSGCSSLTTIIIPEGVTSIGEHAFYYCLSLTAINIPESVTYIGYEAFYQCSSLTTITIPESVTYIGYGVFYYCENLTSIICNAVRPPFIEDYTIADTDNSISVYVPKGSILAYKEAEGWRELPNIYPLSPNNIASGTCGNDLTWKLNEEGDLTIEGTGEMYDYSYNNEPWSEYREFIQTVTIGEGATSIGSLAFPCYNLTTITIPESVENIGWGAFNSCHNLSSITCKATTPPTINDNNLFNEINESIPVYVPFISVEEYQTNDYWSKFSNVQPIRFAVETFLDWDSDANDTPSHTYTFIASPDDMLTFNWHVNSERWKYYLVITLNEEEILRVSGIKSGTYQHTFTSSGTNTLVVEYTENGSTSIDDDQAKVYNLVLSTTSIVAQGTCGNNLTWVLNKEGEFTIEGIGEMYDYSYEDQPWYAYKEFIQTVTLSESVTNIGDYAFYNCDNLTAVSIPEGVTSIGDYAFEGSSVSGDLTIPYSCKYIGKRAFYGTRITSLDIPMIRSTSGKDVLLTISDFAFGDCESLESVNLHIPAYHIGKNPFIRCDNLVNIDGESYGVFTNDERTQGNVIIDGCLYRFTDNNLELICCPAGKDSYTSPNSSKYVLRSLGDQAFDGCTKITFLDIPNTVKKIGDYSLVLPEEHDNNDNTYRKVIIPESVEEFGEYIFAWHGTNWDVYLYGTRLEKINFCWCNHHFGNLHILFGTKNKFLENNPSMEHWFNVIDDIGRKSTELTVSSVGYATLYLDYNAEIPQGVKVYIASSVEGDRLKMTQVEGVLPAGTGVIVRAQAGTYTFVESTDTPANVEGSLLSGTTTDTYIKANSSYKYYVLAQKDGVIGMYRPKLTNEQFLNNANKAYLALYVGDLGIFDEEVNTDEEGGQLSNRLRFDFGGTTSIDNTQCTMHNAQFTIYDLQGRKVTDTEGLKGIYIVNGRKVVIK